MIKMKSRFEDFRNFAMKGNVLDLAVGVVIGAAFGKIVSSLVGDVIMPLIGLVSGRVNLTSLQVILMPASKAIANSTDLVLHYGSFLQSIVDFLIIALCVYFFIKLIGKFKHKQEKAVAAAPISTKSEALLAEIRDLLKEQKGK